MPQRNTPIYNVDQAVAQEPYYGNYSRLAEQFLKRRNQPIYSIGQGLAEAGGDIAEAYLMRKAGEKEQQKADRSNAAMAQAIVNASNPNEGLYPSFVGKSDPMTTEQRQRYAIQRLADIDPQAAVSAAPGLMQMARAAEPPPKFQDVNLPGGAIGQRDPNTNQLTVPFTPPTQQQSPLARLMAERDALPQGDPRRASYDAAISQQATRAPSNAQTVDLKDGKYILNSDGSLGARLGDLPAREAVPKVKTYYDGEGNPVTLDSNDPTDQDRIKRENLRDTAPTESERASKGYLDRMVAAEDAIQSVVDSGYDPSSLRDKTFAGSTLGNYLASDKGQLYRQAQEDLVRAKLRKESGAVIGEEEMEREIKSLFPQPGDTPEVQDQKRKSRQMAIRQLATTAGLLGQNYLRDANNAKVDGGNDFSQEDLEFTAKQHGISVEEVKRRLANNAP